MFGAISVKTILTGALAAQPRQVDKIARPQREGLRADGPGCPGPGGQPDEKRFDEYTSYFYIGGNDHQQRQDRDGEDDIGENIENFIHNTTPVTGGKPDHHPQESCQPAADNPDQEGRREAMHELGKHIFAKSGGPKPVFAGWRRVGRAGGIGRFVFGNHRADDRQDE